MHALQQSDPGGKDAHVVAEYRIPFTTGTVLRGAALATWQRIRHTFVQYTATKLVQGPHQQ